MSSVLFDHARTARIGLPEAVFCQGKDDAVLSELLCRFGRDSGHAVLFTRLEASVFCRLPEDARKGVDYHALSRTAFGSTLPKRDKGSVAIVTAGTADSAVAWEAARTLDFLGIQRTLFEDCGVAGLWRLMDRLEQINSHTVVIMVAGLDAALASVLGGLCPRPLFGVPTSVGYGVADKGRSALSSMLVTCAQGVGVMNIDNGYGAACAAAKVLNQLCI
jgi:NCAIR mutase (PurE)-related protein